MMPQKFANEAAITILLNDGTNLDQIQSVLNTQQPDMKLNLQKKREAAMRKSRMVVRSLISKKPANGSGSNQGSQRGEL